MATSYGNSILGSQLFLVDHPDPVLNPLLDQVIALIVSAQQSDGYFNKHYSVVDTNKRFTITDSYVSIHYFPDNMMIV
jgi:DUF1680 family protein